MLGLVLSRRLLVRSRRRLLRRSDGLWRRRFDGPLLGRRVRAGDDLHPSEHDLGSLMADLGLRRRQRRLFRKAETDLDVEHAVNVVVASDEAAHPMQPFLSRVGLARVISVGPTWLWASLPTFFGHWQTAGARQAAD